jgi:hypothetical protein
VKVFAKWFYGFDPARWPAVTFANPGARTNLLRSSLAGDVVVFVGTNGAETHESDRGRILGMVEFGRREVDTLQIIPRDNLRLQDFDPQDQFRWPKAIPIVRAWRFPTKPLLVELLGHQLSQGARTYALALDERDSEKILGISGEEIDLSGIPALAPYLREIDNLREAGPTQGPRPTSWTGTVTQNVNTPAVTYALRFGSRDIWKIGHASDVASRLDEVNTHVPFEALGERWTLRFQKQWNSREMAFEMEQAIFRELTLYPRERERVACTETQLMSAWAAALRAT